MPDKRKHRGPHPEDLALFGPEARPALCRAAADYCWLLDRGYASASSLKLVGDRHGLVARQRLAIGRASCRREDAARRQSRRVAPAAMAGRPLAIDGYNVLTTVEAALAGGVLLACRDGAYRDMASMHGSYRRVVETLPALERLGRLLAELGVASCLWHLDRPVSNSGRLKTLMQQAAADHGWPWRVVLDDDPDESLSVGDPVAATADSAVLDRCSAWFNLARTAVEGRIAGAIVVDLVPDDPPGLDGRRHGP